MRVLTAADIDAALDWPGLVAHLDARHREPRARVDDITIEDGGNTLLTRVAWLPGGPFGVKAVSIVPENRTRGAALVQGVVVVFDEHDGRPAAVLDGAAVTRWKTAADSVCAARHLARPDAATLLVVGAGVIAGTLLDAYLALFPSLRRVRVWNRTPARADALIERARTRGVDAARADDLDAALGEADVVTAATMATEPLLHGGAVRAGAHVDLVGAFSRATREADDALIGAAHLFVDSRATALETGELAGPIAGGVISADAVEGDLYDLCAGRAGRTSATDVTVYKNGGGAHLDLMVAAFVLARSDGGTG